MVRRLGWCVLIALFAAGCGDRTEIVLVLASSVLRAPEDMDTITVRSFGLDEDTPRLDVTIDVASTTRLPIDVLLEPSDDTPSPLVHQIECYQGDTRVCALSATHAWSRDAVTRVEIRLDAP